MLQEKLKITQHDLEKAIQIIDETAHELEQAKVQHKDNYKQLKNQLEQERKVRSSAEVIIFSCSDST